MSTILVVERATQVQLTQLQLPAFCVEHMKTSSPEANLAMMKKYIEGKLARSVQTLFLHANECVGLGAADCVDGLVLEVDL